MSIWRLWWGGVSGSIREPRFWDAPAYRFSPLSTALLPASWVYAGATRLRWAMANPARVGVPVICVGNLVAGGAGKTPTALAIADHLKALNPHFLTRGYRGNLARLARVNPARHTAREVGDEALLLAEHAPTWASPDRAAAAGAAIAAGAGALVMDDGFQNPGLAKDVSLVVVDGDVGFGNGRLLPAGPLRETPARGLARAQAVVVVGGDGDGGRLDTGGLPVLHARLEPVAESAQALRGARVIAFAGIGRPAKFFASLRALDCDLVSCEKFPDHHPFTAAQIGALRSEANATGSRLVTTTKDRARLGGGAPEGLEVLEVRMVFSDPGTLDAVLAPVLSP